ncbi:DUF748 domain-containing protein [Pandoraea sp.]|uniref:DUF748 domain-containing protein n=1 Tax=Pandoraea sp. TaxID=1883445 RepID=UPI00120466AD|nr:DUF748 domain-containing protein [Pandoraea sp.]TAL52994.1 MAG: DUF748 domain-containing protein [Pandoraea sp.]TAM19406.1 MAG: DUF748 domain-containing protein [Pandoraea sp.]
MADPAHHPTRSKLALQRMQEIGRSPRTRKGGLITLVVILAFGLITYFSVPPLMHRVVAQKLGQWLERPVSFGEVSVNPYTLRLDIHNVHIGDRQPGQPFVDIGLLHVDVSWSSLWRFAPVIDELTIDRPKVHIVRTAEQRFNFSDLIDKATQGPKPKEPSKPTRFAIYNVQVRDGTIQFDDRVLNAQHHVQHLQLGIPFIANLSSDTNVFVQPLLQASIDGSPLRLTGKLKPFASSLDSIIDLKLDQFDLPRYLGYAPAALPFDLKQGTLSADLRVQFVRSGSTPNITLSGTLGMDNVDLRDARNAPLVSLKHAEANLGDVEPLRNIVHLNAVRIDGLAPTVVVEKDGKLNFQRLVTAPGTPARTASAAGQTVAAAKPAAAPSPSSVAPASSPSASSTAAANTASAAAAKATAPAPLDLAITAFNLTNSTLHYRDERAAPAVAATLENIHIALRGVQTLGSTPASYDIGAQLPAGGSLAAQGGFTLSSAQANGELTLHDIALSALQPLLKSVLAGDIKGGTLSAQAKFKGEFAAGKPNLQVAPASLALDRLDVRSPDKRDTPLKVAALSAHLTNFDLLRKHVDVGSVTVKGLDASIRREHDGAINLLRLVAAAPAHGAAGTPAKAPERHRSAPPAEQSRSAPWQWQIGTLGLENAAVSFDDEAVAGHPVKVQLTSLNAKVQDISQDLAKPLHLEINGTVQRRGTLSVNGTVSPEPLKGTLAVRTQSLDLAAFEPYIDMTLNASIASALLSAEGKLGFARQHDKIQISYLGNATLGNVLMRDKLTSESFLRWGALSAEHIDLHYGTGEPKIHVGALSLSRFYSRIIINSNGRLNLEDLVAKKSEAPKSLTRAEPQGTPATSAATSAATPAGAPVAGAGKAIPADIAIGRVTLQGGRINFTDNFIKPNYTANLTQIGGSVGAFGTQSNAPADVVLKGSVDNDAPININGKINPLTPMAFVDIKAKADGIELTNLTPYSDKYTGYPIEKGKLSLDVHYLLDQGKLTADNHIFIDQLTFGDRVENDTATNLPVRLAVALLKNSRGEIDVQIPVSGSLSDPQFSLGSVIVRAVVNLIVKAVTAPFNLLASAFGGGDQQLGFVAFAPGSSTLDAASIKKLETLVKALNDRPALQLDIIGRVDPDKDTEGLREAKVMRLVRAQKREALIAEGANPDTGPITVAPDEYNKYLELAYKAAKFPKPRNFIGFAKSLPPAEMKKLLAANMTVTEQDLRALANARANAVREWFTGKIAANRLYVVAPKLTAEGIKDKGDTTRVDFSLK